MAQRCHQIAQIQQPIGAHRQHRKGKAAPFQLAHGVEHGLVLRGHRDQVTAQVLPRFRQPLERQVVGLGGAAGEHHPLDGHPQLRRQLLARPLHRRGRLQPRPVQAARWIGEQLAPVRRHRFHHRRLTRGGGLVVQVGMGHGIAWGWEHGSGRCCGPCSLVAVAPHDHSGSTAAVRARWPSRSVENGPRPQTHGLLPCPCVLL